MGTGDPNLPTESIAIFANLSPPVDLSFFSSEVGRQTISFLVVANMQVKEITGDQQIRAENKIMRKSFRACGRSVLSRLKNGLIAEGCSPHPALK